jgi:hypothetical protein
MDKELELLTRDGTVPQDACRAMREAIQRVTEQNGRLYEGGALSSVCGGDGLKGRRIFD